MSTHAPSSPLPSGTRVHTPLTDLANELLLQIIDELDHQDVWYLCRRKDTPLKNMSLVSRHLRLLLLPRLFRSLDCIFDPSEVAQRRPFYDLSSIKTIPQQQHLKDHTKSLQLEFRDAKRCFQPDAEPAHYTMLFNIFMDLPQLTSITLEMSDLAKPGLQQAIDAIPTSMRLDCVKTLKLTCNAGFLIAHSPNVETLHFMGCYDTKLWKPRGCRLYPADTVRHLILEGPSIEDRAKDLAQAYPNVESLGRHRYSVRCILDPNSIGSRTADFATHFVKLRSVERQHLGLCRGALTGVVETDENGARCERWNNFRIMPLTQTKRDVWADSDDESEEMDDGSDRAKDDPESSGIWCPCRSDEDEDDQWLS